MTFSYLHLQKVIQEGVVGKSVIESTDETSVEVILPYGTLWLLVDIRDEQGAVATLEIATLTVKYI